MYALVRPLYFRFSRWKWIKLSISVLFLTYQKNDLNGEVCRLLYPLNIPHYVVVLQQHTFIKTINHTYSRSSPASSQSFPSSNRMSPISFFFFFFGFSPHSHCHNCMTYFNCVVTVWKVPAQQQKTNIRKYCIFSKNVPCYLFIFLNCVLKLSLTISVKSPNLSGMNECSWPNW